MVYFGRYCLHAYLGLYVWMCCLLHWFMGLKCRAERNYFFGWFRCIYIYMVVKRQNVSFPILWESRLRKRRMIGAMETTSSSLIRTETLIYQWMFYFIFIYFTTFWGCCASFVGWSFVGINPSFKYMHVLVLQDLIDTFFFKFCKIINFHDFISLCVGRVHTQRDMHSIILYFYSGSTILV